MPFARVDPDFDRGPKLDHSRALYDPKVTKPGKRSLSNSAHAQNQSPSRVLRSGDKCSPTSASARAIIACEITTPSATDVDMNEDHTTRDLGHGRLDFDWTPSAPSPKNTSPQPLTPHHSASPKESPTMTGNAPLPSGVTVAANTRPISQIPPQTSSSTAPTAGRSSSISSSSYSKISKTSKSTSSSTGTTTTTTPLTILQPTASSLTNEIQMAYYEITKLESECQIVSERLKFQSSIQRGLSLEFSRLFDLHSRLIERYVDFMMFAYHPAGSSSMRTLVKKYKIPYRLWSRGIFRYLELLRHELPLSAELMGKFILHCFSLLSLLVEPPFDSRHIWQEALGDVARFGMTMRISELNTVYWEDLCKFWYLKASQREPTVGRLYHHVSMLSVDMIKIFYFCKSMTAQQPFDVNQGGGKYVVLENALGKHHRTFFYHYALFLKHIYLTDAIGAAKRASAICDIWDQGFLALESHKMGRPTSTTYPEELTAGNIANYGAMVAFCNITGVLGVGNHDYNFSRAFYSKYGSSPVPLLQGNVFATDSGQDLALTVMEKSLRFFLNVPKKQSLAHIIVWVHFCLAVHDIPELTRPFMAKHSNLLGLIQAYLDETLEMVKTTVGITSISISANDLRQVLIKWCHSYPETKSDESRFETSVEHINCQFPGVDIRKHYPVTRQRPLPEECMLLGAVWPHKPIDPSIYQDYESYTNDDCYPGDLGGAGLMEQREVKLVELALRLVDKGTWLDFNEEFSCFRVHF